MAKSKTVTRPNRDPDHYSKRGVPYWWAPEWTRGTSADGVYSADSFKNHSGGFTQSFQSKCILNSSGEYVDPCSGYGRIHAVKENGTVNLYMKAKDGNLSYIQGSIQKEFKKWHEDRSIDYLLLGMDPDDIINE